MDEEIEVPSADGPYLLKVLTRKLRVRAQELRERRGGCPGLPVPKSPYGLCGRNATLNLDAQSSGAV